GLPEKRPVLASKRNQLGSGRPLLSRASTVRVALAVLWRNRPAGSAKFASVADVRLMLVADRATTRPSAAGPAPRITNDGWAMLPVEVQTPPTDRLGAGATSELRSVPTGSITGGRIGVPRPLPCSVGKITGGAGEKGAGAAGGAGAIVTGPSIGTTTGCGRTSSTKVAVT